MILPAETHSLCSLLSGYAAALGRGITTQIDVDSYANIKSLLAEGLGFSILPQGAIAQEVAENRLVAWPFEGPTLNRSIYLAHLIKRPHIHAVAAVHKLTDQVLRAIVSAGGWAGARAAGSI